jgi:hypothetical protein
MTVRRLKESEYASLKQRALCPICLYSTLVQILDDPKKYLDGPKNALVCTYFAQVALDVDFSSGTISKEWTNDCLCENFNKYGDCKEFRRNDDKYCKFFKKG